MSATAGAGAGPEEPRGPQAEGAAAKLEELFAELRRAAEDLRAIAAASARMARVRADRARLRVTQLVFLALVLAALSVVALGALAAAGALVALGVAGGLGAAFELPGWLASLLGGLAVLLLAVLALLFVRRGVLRRYGRQLAARYSPTAPR